MNSSIFTRALASRKTSIIVAGGSMFAFALMYTALFQSFAGNFDQFTEAIPEAFEAVIGDISVGATPEGWLGIELYSLFLPLIVASLAIGFGASAIGKEEESGTLELLLASPVSRTKIFTQKALAVATQPGVVALATWAGVAVGTLLFPFDVSLIDTLWASYVIWLLGLVYGSLALMVQSLSGKRVLGFGVAVGALAVTYFAEVFANLIDWLDKLRYISPFHYADGQDVLLNGLDFGYVAILHATFIVFTLLAWWGFKRRDTGV